MDRGGSTEETRRRTKARMELCLVTKGRSGADRLSALPDELLLHILSFLRIRQAISTSSLSRRWRYLYHHLPSLDFSSRAGDHPSAWFIDRVLLLHAAPRIEVFRLSMPPHRDNVNVLTTLRQFYSLVMFAVRRNVRVLDLDFREVFSPNESNYYDDKYNLPPSIFHCRTLEDFSLQHCDLRLPASIRLAALKKMCLSYINFNDDELKRLLLGCPLLQSLELAHCNQWRDLVIDAWESRKLEELVIVDDSDSSSAMDIRAPSVKYLTFNGAAYRLRYHVSDLSSLVVASFQLDDGSTFYEDEAYRFTTNLLLRIHRVQVLKLCSWSLRALSTRELQGNLDSAFPCVTRLELTTELEEPELQAIPSALRACSKLRTLVLDIQRHKMNHYSDSDESDEPDEPDETQDPQSLALDSTIMMQDLKTIMIQGLTRYDQDPEEEGSETEELKDIVLIGFLLEVSPALEKLVVRPAKYMNTMAEKWELLFKLSSDLLSLPRASPKARVIIEGK